VERAPPMKKFFAIILVILLGIALGVGVAALRIKTATWNPAADEAGQNAKPARTEGGKPATKVSQVSKLRSSQALASWNDEERS
jgi:hypothetical protein